MAASAAGNMVKSKSSESINSLNVDGSLKDNHQERFASACSPSTVSADTSLPMSTSFHQQSIHQCAVSGIALDANQVDCHHKKPLSLGGDDSYQNLIIVSDAVHVLIHSSSERTIKKYLNDLQLNSKQLAKLNNLRKLAEMPQITL